MGRYDVSVTPFPESSRTRAFRSFATRRVQIEDMVTLVRGSARPRSGDVVLARIERLGQHRRIEEPSGRRAALHVGDEIIVAYADRYATDQYESFVPVDLGRVQLVASGGIASQTQSRSRLVRQATDIVPIGLVGDRRGRPLNVADFALDRIEVPETRPRVIAVMGTAMNSGKTTTIHYLAHGLARAGAKPGVTKVTGTGSGNDYWVMLDAGVHRMLDFTDAGLASTFRQPLERLEDVAGQLVAHLAQADSGVIFVEIADGVFQTDNRYLLKSTVLHDLIDCAVFASSDAMGAAHGVWALRELGFDVRAVSGTLTRSPLAAREAEEAIGLPVWGIPELMDAPEVASVLGIHPTVLQEPTPPAEAAWEVDVPGLAAAMGESTCPVSLVARPQLVDRGA